MVGAKEEFAVVTFNTDGLPAGQGLKMLDMEEFTRDLNNQGKVLVRKDAHWKLGPKGIAMLGAVYIPSHDVSAMDLKVGEGQQAQEVAAEWVATNKYIVTAGAGDPRPISKVNGNARRRGACWASAAVCMDVHACPAALG